MVDENALVRLLDIVKSSPYPLALLLIFWADWITSVGPINNWLKYNLTLYSRYAARPNPIGIIGSIFIYDGIFNIILLTLVTAAFYLVAYYLAAGSHYWIPQAKVSRLSTIFFASSLAAAILANVAWYLYPDPETYASYPAYGTSGVVAGAAGSLTMMILLIIKIKSIANRLTMHGAFSGHRSNPYPAVAAVIGGALWAITLVFIFGSFITREVFTPSGDIVNLWVHYVSFFCGLIIMFIASANLIFHRIAMHPV